MTMHQDIDPSSDPPGADARQLLREAFEGNEFATELESVMDAAALRFSTEETTGDVGGIDQEFAGRFGLDNKPRHYLTEGQFGASAFLDQDGKVIVVYATQDNGQVYVEVSVNGEVAVVPAYIWNRIQARVAACASGDLVEEPADWSFRMDDWEPDGPQAQEI